MPTGWISYHRAMAGMVLLEHTLTDGSWHLDWMLQRPSPRGDRLVTFRVRDRLDTPGVMGWIGERLGDHRAAYLSYEGVISGGRGTVRRVAAGSCSWVVLDEDRCELDAAWPGVAGRVVGGRIDAGRWRFELRVR